MQMAVSLNYEESKLDLVQVLVGRVNGLNDIDKYLSNYLLLSLIHLVSLLFRHRLLRDISELKFEYLSERIDLEVGVFIV